MYLLCTTPLSDLWDSPQDSHQREAATTAMVSARRKWIVLLWFVVLATSYAGERSTFKLLVDRAGPFRLFAVEVVTAVHAILLGVSMLVYALVTTLSSSSSAAASAAAAASSSISAFYPDGTDQQTQQLTSANNAADGGGGPAVAVVGGGADGGVDPTAAAAAIGGGVDPAAAATTAVAGGGGNRRSHSHRHRSSTSYYADKPLGLGVPLVDVSLMALLDVVNLILVFLTGIYVPPTLTVILVQFLLPLTVFLTQFSHPDGRFACCRDSAGSSNNAASDDHPPAPATSALPGWGGLGANHLWGSLIIFAAVALAMVPALYSIANPDFFVYADAIPLRTAYNSLLFVSACIPAAASQLYKEHVFLYYKQPVNIPLLNLVLSVFQFLFASVLAPLVFGLQGLGAKTDEDWATLYPNTAFSQNFLDGLACFFRQLSDDDQENKYPEEARCDLTLILTILHAFSIIAVGVAVDRIVNAGATKVMYRGISAGIILAVLCMQAYDASMVEFSYGPFVDGLNLICALLLILGSEVYHRVSLSDSTFETVYPPMENLYETE